MNSAHVSTAGGVHRAPERAAALRSHVLQLFTKAPGRWADPVIDAETVAAFRSERERWKIGATATHDAYLINLGTADRALFRARAALPDAAARDVRVPARVREPRHRA